MTIDELKQAIRNNDRITIDAALFFNLVLYSSDIKRYSENAEVCIEMLLETANIVIEKLISSTSEITTNDLYETKNIDNPLYWLQG